MEGEAQLRHTYFSAIAYTLACVMRCGLSTSASGSAVTASKGSSVNWSAVGVSGSFADASRASNWLACSSGGVMGIALPAADAIASSGSSTRAKLTFLGARREKRGDRAPDDRSEELRESGLLR